MNREMIQFVAEVAGCVVALGFVSLLASLVVLRLRGLAQFLA